MLKIKIKKIIALLMIGICISTSIPTNYFSDIIKAASTDDVFNDTKAVTLDVSVATYAWYLTINEGSYTVSKGTSTETISYSGDFIITGNKGDRGLIITNNTNSKIKFKNLTCNGIDVTNNKGGVQSIFVEGYNYSSGATPYINFTNTTGNINVYGLDGGSLNISEAAVSYNTKIKAVNVNVYNFKPVLGRFYFEGTSSVYVENSNFNKFLDCHANNVTLENCIVNASDYNFYAVAKGTINIKNSFIKTMGTYEAISATSGVNIVNSSLVLTGKFKSYGASINFENSSYGAIVNNALPSTKDTLNYNEMGQNVYPVYIRVPKCSLIKVKVTVDNWSEPVELYTDASGNLYPLLTVGKHKIKIETPEGKTYELEVEPTLDSTTTPIEPTETVYQDVTVERANTSYTYKFDTDSEVTTVSNSGSVISVPKVSGKTSFSLKSNTEPLKYWNAEVASDGTVGVLNLVKPTIISQSSDKTLKENDTTVLDIVVIPSRVENTLTYQWYKDGELLSSEDKQLIVAGSEGLGTYTCKITESNGLSVISTEIIVSRDDSVSKDDYEELQNKYNELQDKYDKLKDKYDSLIIENTDNEELISTLRDKIAELEQKITELEASIVNKDETISNLIDQITILTNKVNSLDTLLDSIRSVLGVTTNDEIIPKIQEILAQLESLRNDYIDLSDEYDDYKNNAQITIDSLTEQVKELQEQLNNSNADLNDVKSELADALVQIDELRSLVNSIKDELGVTDDSEIIPAIQELKRKIEELKSKYNDLIIENSTNSITIITLTERITELENIITQLESDAITNAATIKDLQDRINELTTKVNEYETLIDNIKSLLEVTTNDEIIPKIQEILAQLEALKNDYSNLSDEFNEYKVSAINKIEELTIKISQLEQELENKDIELDSVKRELADALAQITDLRTLVDLIKSELGVTDDSDIIPAIKALKDRIAGLESQVTDLQDKLNSANSTIEDLTNDKNEYIERLEKMKDLVEADNTDEIESKIKDMKDLISKYEEKINQLEKEKEDLEKEISDQLKEIQDLKDALKGDTQDLLNRIKELEEQIKALEIRNSNLSDQVDSLNQSISDLTTENTELKKQIIEIQTQLDIANSTIEELQKKVIDLTVENELLKDENAKLKAENEELKRHECPSNEDLLNQIERLNKEIENLKNNHSTNSNTVTVPDNSVVVTPTTNTDNIIEQTDNKVSAESGWELNTSLDKGKWTDEVAMENLIETTGTFTFFTGKDLAKSFSAYIEKTVVYARKKSDPSNVYVCSFNVDKGVPGYTSPTGSMSSDTKGVTFVYDESNRKVVNTTGKVTFSVDGDFGVAGKKGIYYKVVAVDNDFDPDGSWVEVENNSFSIEVNQQVRVYIKYVDNYGNYTVSKTTVLDSSKRLDVPVLLLNKTVYVDNSYKLQQDVETNGNKIMYTSSDNSIATVSENGLIKAKKNGKATVVCTVYDKSGTLIYKYEVAVKVKESKDKTLSLKKNYSASGTDDVILQSYKLINKGKSTKLSIKANKDAKVMYVTSDNTVATVTSKGIVTGKAKGSADITVVVYQNEKFYTYVVKVRVTDGTKDKSIKNYLK